MPVLSINEGDENSPTDSELLGGLGGADDSLDRTITARNSSSKIRIRFPLPPEPSPSARKRFSMPAIALQTTSVTARPNVVGEGQGKRFSLVLGGRHKVSSSYAIHEGTVPQDEIGELRYGVAAAKLAKLLERTRVTSGGD